MSRIGKKPINIPENVTASISQGRVEVKGPNGTREFLASKEVLVELADNQIVVKPINLSKKSRQHWGMNRTQISNLIQGVTGGFSKHLELNGVGYRASLQGKTLKLALGYSHEIEFEVPEAVKITVPKPTEIIINGVDQQIVGQIAANIREKRKPEPYKGKGIRYKDEYVFAKEGKKK
ncbi:MAG: 50S ribosomal protein L6 [Rhodobacteraceae bacterium]|nr:50S ribosomal protein L6 [Paracoccaceae bacterium]